MESKVVVEAALPGTKKSSFPPAEGGDEDAMAAAASPAAILARPLSLLRHAVHCCAGYLGGLASRLKPVSAGAAAACRQPQQQEEGNVEAAAAVVTEETMVVEVQSRGVPPQRPRGLKEGKGGNGGVHRK